MQRTIKALYVKENELPKEIVLSNTLKDKQEKVGGLIQYVPYLEDEEITIICNEEGKINGMGPNRDIGYDILYGPFLIVGETANDGEDRSLTEEQIKKYKERFNEKSIEETIAKYNAIVMSKINNFEI